MKIKLVILFFLLLHFGCEKKDDKSEVVARVDKSTLTVQDINSEIGDNATIKRQKAFVKRWIDRELLYQAACDSGLNKDPFYKQKIINSEKNLLSMAYLKKNLSKSVSTITDKDVYNYYLKNKDKYLRDEPVIRYAQYSLSTVKSAWNVRNGLTKDNFFASSKRFSKHKTIPANQIHFVKKSSLPKTIQDKLFSIREGGITTPIRVGDDVNLYLVLQKGAKGTVATFDEVKDQVRNDLEASIAIKQVDSLITAIKEDNVVFYNSDYFNKSK